MATDAQVRFHRDWLGLAQPYGGLVFSVPVLADAQITPEISADLTARFKRELLQPEGEQSGYIGDLRAFFESFLGYTGGKWFVANLDDPKTRRAAEELARQHGWSCVKRELVLQDCELPISGSGGAKVSSKPSRRVVVCGDVRLALPASVEVRESLDLAIWRR